MGLILKFQRKSFSAVSAVRKVAPCRQRQQLLSRFLLLSLNIRTLVFDVFVRRGATFDPPRDPLNEKFWSMILRQCAETQPLIYAVAEVLCHGGRDMSSSLAAFYFVFVIVSSLFSREENPLWHF